MITLSGRSLEISISFIFFKKIYSDDHIIWKEPGNLKIKKSVFHISTESFVSK
jgi:hypothetical protein